MSKKINPFERMELLVFNGNYPRDNIFLALGYEINPGEMKILCCIDSLYLVSDGPVFKDGLDILTRFINLNSAVSNDIDILIKMVSIGADIHIMGECISYVEIKRLLKDLKSIEVN